jgi:hypothetical protein
MNNLAKFAFSLGIILTETINAIIALISIAIRMLKVLTFTLQMTMAVVIFFLKIAFTCVKGFQKGIMTPVNILDRYKRGSCKDHLLVLSFVGVITLLTIGFYHQWLMVKTYHPSVRPMSASAHKSAYQRILDGTQGMHSASPYYPDNSPQALKAISTIPTWMSTPTSETPEELDRFKDRVSFYWDGLVKEAQSLNEQELRQSLDFDRWWSRRISLGRQINLEQLNQESNDLNLRRSNLLRLFQRYMIALHDLKESL